jgi:hypothetical protein
MTKQHPFKISLIIIITIALTFLLSSISYAQEQNLKDLNLNGPVKLYEVKIYSAINNGILIVKGNPIWEEHQFVKFNKKGIKIEDNYYNTNNEYMGKAVYYHYPKELYNKTIFTDSIGKISGYEIHKFDQHNNLVQFTSYDKNDMVIDSINYKNIKSDIIYDSFGNKTEEINYNLDGEKDGKQTYKYNKKQQLIEDISYNNANRATYRTTIKYDVKKNILETSFFTESPLLVGTEFIIENGIEYTEETTWTTEEMTLEMKITYTYKYDIKGNWIQKVVFENDLPLKIMEREIEYY